MAQHLLSEQKTKHVRHFLDTRVAAEQQTKMAIK